MAGTRTHKPKSGNLEAEQADWEEERQESEQAEQQDLNQGMSTGTHDTARHGVDWPSSYRSRAGERSGRQKSAAGPGARKRRDNKS